MPGPFPPNDDVLGPILHQLAMYIAAQIPSIATVFEKVPDRPTQDNTVILPITRAKVVDETNGKVKVLFMIGAKHIFRRREFDSAVTQAYTYITPWLKLLASWNNQTLGGLAIQTSPKDLQVMQFSSAGQPYIALAIDFEVLTEFNIPLT